MKIREILVHPRLRKLRRGIMGLIPSKLEVSILSGSLSGTRWITGAGYPGYWLGTFEKEKQQFIADLIKPGSVVFDIGAHVGFYTLLAAHKVGENGKVYAFEPAPNNINYLKKHVALNEFDNVHVIEAAVADSDGTTYFDFRTSSYSGQIADGGDVEVVLRSLDSLIQSGEVEQPDLIKIDVEGAESLVLDGSQSLLANYKPKLLIAIHGSEQLALCEQKLQTLGYDVEKLEEHQAGIHFDLLAELLATAKIQDRQ